MNDSGIKILFSEKEIVERISELGREISEFYQDQPLTVVTLANGGVFFGCDLVRSISVPDCWFDVIAAGSYTKDIKNGFPEFRCREKLEVRDRHILIADDVFDSGDTMKLCQNYFLHLGAASARSAVLIDKEVPGRMTNADWYCFRAPDLYLVGCGMDSCELYRNMREIGYIEK